MDDALMDLRAIRLTWERRADVVRRARNQGKTWDEIRDALGVSRMTAITLAQTGGTESRRGKVS